MRPIEIRLLEGPNVYRLEPVVKVEVAIGRQGEWRGSRTGASNANTLGARVRRSEWPEPVLVLAGWTQRLRLDHGEGSRSLAVHRGSDPGHWIVTWPWRGAERARSIAEASVDLAARRIPAGRSERRTAAEARRLAVWEARIAASGATPPAWIRDSDRRIPIVSISGTNGKTTVTRLIAHILRRAGRRVGFTTSDGIVVGERLVEPGDWTGPAGASQILHRSDIDVAVLETARGGILLRGVGYESNEASVLTNISPDHLDLQGVHTLPELAEVKATIARMTRPDGWVVLNADDPWLAPIARRVRAHVAFFSLAARPPTILRRVLARGGRAYLLDGRDIVEVEATGTRRRIADVRDVPITIGGLARHNVANALAAAGGARALGASIDDVARGLADFRPSMERSPGRLNLFRVGNRIVIVDFAHNEAGLEAVLDVADGIAAGAAGRTAPITAIVGTAGDRPDDALRGIGRIAARRAQRIAIKETPRYLRGRAAEDVVARLREGIASAGRSLDDIAVHPSEVAALRAELGESGPDGRADRPRIIVLMCHAERDEVVELLNSLGARQVDVSAELSMLVPRLQDRARR